MAKEHPLCQKEKLYLSDLQDAKIVLVNGDSWIMQQLQGELETVNCTPQIVLDGAEWEQAMSLVSKAGYVSFCLPPKKPEKIPLATRKVEDMKLPVSFNMAIMKDRKLTAA